jgi:hypothetical protein
MTYLSPETLVLAEESYPSQVAAVKLSKFFCLLPLKTLKTDEVQRNAKILDQQRSKNDSGFKISECGTRDGY